MRGPLPECAQMQPRCWHPRVSILLNHLEKYVGLSGSGIWLPKSYYNHQQQFVNVISFHPPLSLSSGVICYIVIGNPEGDRSSSCLFLYLAGTCENYNAVSLNTQVPLSCLRWQPARFLFCHLTHTLGRTLIRYSHKTNSANCCRETSWSENLEAFASFSPFSLEVWWDPCHFFMSFSDGLVNSVGPHLMESPSVGIQGWALDTPTFPGVMPPRHCTPSGSPAMSPTKQAARLPHLTPRECGGRGEKRVCRTYYRSQECSRCFTYTTIIFLSLKRHQSGNHDVAWTHS